MIVFVCLFQVTRMILLDIAVVSLSNIPLGMFLLYAGTRNSSARFTAIEALLIVTTQLISTVQVFGSFYFYMLVSSTFRNNVKKLLYRIFCCGKTNGEHRVGPLTVTVGVRRTVLVAPKSMKISSVVIWIIFFLSILALNIVCQICIYILEYTSPAIRSGNTASLISVDTYVKIWDMIGA